MSESLHWTFLKNKITIRTSKIAGKIAVFIKRFYSCLSKQDHFLEALYVLKKIGVRRMFQCNQVATFFKTFSLYYKWNGTKLLSP